MLWGKICGDTEHFIRYRKERNSMTDCNRFILGDYTVIRQLSSEVVYATRIPREDES